jgi:transcriptional regulator with XRE-family HTH domain
MPTRKLSGARQYMAQLRGGPLTFGEMIESLREADGISQTELARKLKISRAQLCDIEKGRRAIFPKRAAQFAKVMGYSVDQFVALALEDELRREGLPRKVSLSAA